MICISIAQKGKLMKRKCLAVIIILLFIIPSTIITIAQDTEKTSQQIEISNKFNSLGPVTVNVTVFGWYPHIGGWPYLLSEASVYIRVVGITPSIILGRNLVGCGLTNFTGHFTIEIPAPMDNSFCYLIYARKFGFRPCYRPDFPAQSFQFVKLKANDTPEDIWLVLIGWPFS